MTHSYTTSGDLTRKLDRSTPPFPHEQIVRHKVKVSKGIWTPPGGSENDRAATDLGSEAQDNKTIRRCSVSDISAKLR